jgi:hypothetical protein
MKRLLIPLLSLPTLAGCGDKTVDLDGDGFPETVDCDDRDSAAYPGGEEVCDEVDNDCDGEIDEDPTDGQAWSYDGDGDGYGSDTYPTLATCGFSPPEGYVDNGDDCNDASAASSPSGVEVCDGEDNDCNGNIDDFALDPSLWYFDFDSDGYGDPSTSQLLCDPPSGWVDNGTDCDDTDAEINPGQEWYVDADQDGFGNPDYRLTACGEQVGFSGDGSDCDDGEAAIFPGADELCDGIDNNCDDAIDEDTAIDAGTWYTDNDGDGYGDTDTAVTDCAQPESSIDIGGDCADDDVEINPGAPDWCGDGVDGNCDGDVDTRCVISATDADVRIVGENAYDYMGTAISAGGDFNGDGSTDIAIGAHLNGDTATSAGKVYLLLGPLTDGEHEAADAALTVTGASSVDYAGYTVALGGDIDDDGYDELLLSAYLSDLSSSQTNSGSAYVFYGPTSSDRSADDADATITGADGQNYTGQYTLGTVEDLNGDGYDEVYVGAIYYDGSLTYAGMLATFYGPLSGTMDLEDADIQITGSSSYRYVGYGSAFTDFDGDSVVDVIYSEPNANTVYGITGPLSGELTATDASLEIASTDSDFTGSQIHDGDFNGDGYVDILISAHLDDSYLNNAGEVSVLYGPVSGSLTLAAAAFSMHGEAETSYLGGPAYALSVGDLDDDGSDDFFVGSPFSDLVAENAGSGYLLYGPVSGTAQVAPDVADRILVGEDAADALGWGSDIADINDDGSLDLLFTARGADSYYGVAYAIDGSGL